MDYSGNCVLSKKKLCVLITGGKWHDMAYAREELKQTIARQRDVEISMHDDFSCIDLIESAHLLVTYTCDLIPSVETQARLRRFVERGGRWLALHGTNSVLRFLPDGRIDTPDEAPYLMETLGSRFLAHPPINTYIVAPTCEKDPITDGIEPFHVEDELYLTEVTASIRVLLDTEFAGTTPRFTCAHWPQARHPVLYECRHGGGSVLYFTLGHCRGPHDMRPLIDVYPHLERGAWNSPAYRTILDRCIHWGLGGVTVGNRNS